MKKHLPNILTCFNLFCGCVATVLIFRNHLVYASYFIFAAAFFDLFDGMVARIVKSNSSFGKELDSLADVVSFGFVPGVMMFKLLQFSELENYFSSDIVIRIIEFLPFIITIFSALRLAKFNLDTRQSNSFIGFPTPANTLLIVSFPLVMNQFPGRYDDLILNPYFILITCLVCSLLMISELPLFSLKFKTMDVKENMFQYILLISALILLPLLLFAAIPVLIILYLLLSFIQNKIKPST